MLVSCRELWYQLSDGQAVRGPEKKEGGESEQGGGEGMGCRMGRP
jgi:hypothetical protein